MGAHGGLVQGTGGLGASDARLVRTLLKPGRACRILPAGEIEFVAEPSRQNRLVSEVMCQIKNLKHEAVDRVFVLPKLTHIKSHRIFRPLNVRLNMCSHERHLTLEFSYERGALRSELVQGHTVQSQGSASKLLRNLDGVFVGTRDIELGVSTVIREQVLHGAQRPITFVKHWMECQLGGVLYGSSLPNRYADRN